MSLRNLRFWNCCVLGCPAAAAIDLGLCDRCRQHFCALHLSSPSHGCPGQTAAQTEELKNLRRMVNDQCLLRRASERYGGLPCALLDWALMGKNNDAMKAVCATLKWLENIDVPSPKLHDYSLRTDRHNNVGVAYMLIDELPRIPLLHKRPSVEELRRVYDGYAKILSTLQGFPFHHIGCLSFRQDGDIHVGPIVGDKMYLEMICSGQLFSAYPINAYLVFNYLKHLASTSRWNALEPILDDGPFFLKIWMTRGYHILVDERYNITGIIDWTYARVVPACEAYGLSL
ncbi:hypothetical protein AFGD_001064 [Aspergillus flavus]|nr:hypothetical protein AFGD_001064 [Aspergillus flavus]